MSSLNRGGRRCRLLLLKMQLCSEMLLAGRHGKIGDGARAELWNAQECAIEEGSHGQKKEITRIKDLAFASKSKSVDSGHIGIQIAV
jgi:hypothetical protein